MRRLLYLFALICLGSCNTKKPEANQNYVVKPEDLTSLNQRINTTVTNPAATSTALNPAHGQPGHRCDLAVGAPLSSKPAQTSSPTNQNTTSRQITTITQPVNTTSNPTVQTTSVNEKVGKINPAHGQPNHRCDIAVGAPLNSKSMQATASKPQVGVTQPTAANTAQVPLLNEKGQKLNPAHGQPNHRCDIAVGAPLT